MKKLLSLFIIIMTFASCADKAKEEFMNELQSAVNNNSKDSLLAIMPIADSLEIDWSGCKLDSYIADSIMESGDTIVVQTRIVLVAKKDTCDAEIIATRNKDGRYTVIDTRGLIAISKNSDMARIAIGTGALPKTCSDMQAKEFLSNKNNIKDIEGLMQKLSSEILSASIHMGQGKEDYSLGCINYVRNVKVTLENKSKKEFSNVKVKILFRMCYAATYQNEYEVINFKRVTPGKNVEAYNRYCGGGSSFLVGNPRIVDISGISKEEYLEAMKDYKFKGTEYQEYKDKRK